jgi:protoporphyrinogen/coproporphyrinogen III oxidase
MSTHNGSTAVGGNQHTLRPKHVVVIGGGIAGLSCAYYLQKAQAEGSPLSYTLVERGDRWGGKILTEYVDGYGDQPFVIEAGPDSFISQKPWAHRLVEEMGIAHRLLGTNDERRKTYVLRGGKPVPLPDGVLMIIPTRIVPFALSPLFSLPGKLRMGMDLFIPPKMDGEDETLAEFVSRRLGDEAVDRLAEPLMSGIYNSEADRQSLLATFPRFRAMEEKHGSLVRGMLASRRTARESAAAYPDQKPQSIFESMHDGAGELVTAVADRLTGDLRLNTAVTHLARQDDQYVLDLSGGKRLTADAVVFATPAFITADLVRPVAPATADHLDSIRYLSTGTITLAFRLSEMKHPPQGFGIVVPRSERRRINAITWSSEKFDFRAPDGYLLLRAFFGGSRSPETMHKDDAELLQIAIDELRDMMGLTAVPVFSRIYRWFDANPQYDVGHLDLVNSIETSLPPGLFVTGSAYRGIGLPDCIHRAELTVHTLVEQMYENHESQS